MTSSFFFFFGDNLIVRGEGSGERLERQIFHLEIPIELRKMPLDQKINK